LRHLPIISTGAGLIARAVDPDIITEREHRMMKLIKDLIAFLYSLLDVVAYRLTFS
jgi:hypothetical protein